MSCCQAPAVEGHAETVDACATPGSKGDFGEVGGEVSAGSGADSGAGRGTEKATAKPWRGSRLRAPRPGPARVELLDLAWHYLTAYDNGNMFQCDKYDMGYLKELQSPVMVHRQTDIRVLENPVDLRSWGTAAATPAVVFHYASFEGAVRIAKAMSVSDGQIFEAMRDLLGHFGEGILATSRCPDQFGSKEAALLNLHWPRCGDRAHGPAHPSNLLMRGGGVGTGPEDARNSEVRRAILEDPALACGADYCIPVLIDQQSVYDIWARIVPDLAETVPVGCNRWGEEQWKDRSISVVQIPKQSEAFTAVVPSSNDVRAPATVDRQFQAMHKRVDHLEATLGQGHTESMLALGMLAAKLAAGGDDEKAEPLLRKWVAQSEEALGDDHEFTLIALGNLAANCRKLGRPQEAEELGRRRLEASDRILGPAHPSSIAALRGLARTLESQGRSSEVAELKRAEQQREAELARLPAEPLPLPPPREEPPL